MDWLNDKATRSDEIINQERDNYFRAQLRNQPSTAGSLLDGYLERALNEDTSRPSAPRADNINVDMGGYGYNYHFDPVGDLDRAQSELDASRSQYQAYAEQLANANASWGNDGVVDGVLQFKNSGKGFGKSAYGFKNIITGQPAHRGSAPYGLQPVMWNALQAIFKDMEKAGVGKPGINGGFRSYEQQVKLKQIKPTLAATAGNSVHGLGLAVDLNLSKSQLRYMEQNGYRYGLARLPSESWHWQIMPEFVNGNSLFDVSNIEATKAAAPTKAEAHAKTMATQRLMRAEAKNKPTPAPKPTKMKDIAGTQYDPRYARVR